MHTKTTIHKNTSSAHKFYIFIAQHTWKCTSYPSTALVIELIFNNPNSISQLVSRTNWARHHVKSSWIFAPRDDKASSGVSWISKDMALEIQPPPTHQHSGSLGGVQPTVSKHW